MRKMNHTEIESAEAAGQKLTVGWVSDIVTHAGFGSHGSDQQIISSSVMGSRG